MQGANPYDLPGSSGSSQMHTSVDAECEPIRFARLIWLITDAHTGKILHNMFLDLFPVCTSHEQTLCAEIFLQHLYMDTTSWLFRNYSYPHGEMRML